MSFEVHDFVGAVLQKPPSHESAGRQKPFTVGYGVGTGVGVWPVVMATMAATTTSAHVNDTFMAVTLSVDDSALIDEYLQCLCSLRRYATHRTATEFVALRRRNGCAVGARLLVAVAARIEDAAERA